MANRSNIEECFAKENYMEAWSCYNGYPHSAGHGAVGGLNMPDESVLDMADLSAAGSELTDYNGDPGNVTTLNHVLFILNLVPNVTISDIMDLGGDTICAEYVD
ncbi:Amino acid transporter [Lasiodiplodia theobromae]|uniref:Amino acid transporter n=1 Tax=Lasiodiplodia theobromae TaxID=45133 RepID=UPI0015C32E09|nr:Amino acid transporter [Lasiodiplodia theobromae]KAF4544054.1 Amino acid transporter [Lasiodiplodia theobromae]